MREIFFYFTFQSNQFENFSTVKSIEFYSFDVKAIFTKKSGVVFCENIQKKRNVIKEIIFFSVAGIHTKTLSKIFLVC